jgi:hypothetical protein
LSEVKIKITRPALKLLEQKEVYGFDGHLLVFMAGIGCKHASVLRRGDHIEIIFWEISEKEEKRQHD